MLIAATCGALNGRLGHGTSKLQLLDGIRVLERIEIVALRVQFDCRWGLSSVQGGGILLLIFEAGRREFADVGLPAHGLSQVFKLKVAQLVLLLSHARRLSLSVIHEVADGHLGRGTALSVGTLGSRWLELAILQVLLVRRLVPVHLTCRRHLVEVCNQV